MTKYSIDSPRKYLRVYCSFDVPVNDIVENAKTNTDEITSISHLNFNVDEKKVQECSAHIQKMLLGINEDLPQTLKISGKRIIVLQIFLREQVDGNLRIRSSKGEVPDNCFTFILWNKGHLHRFNKHTSISRIHAEMRISSERMNVEKLQSGLLKKVKAPNELESTNRKKFKKNTQVGTPSVLQEMSLFDMRITKTLIF
ncbi:unnamed protein product [Blumeria hordei]|uniref:Uncharacterized protein n=1 Tax=Blumeria hordei TaxID=2867405 RepID=A0A383UZ79_BLUHO|nr:unnamed protein product [Blumeria hordei]